METEYSRRRLFLILSSALLLQQLQLGVECSLYYFGVVYGRNGNNMPKPSDVVTSIVHTAQTHRIINKVIIYDAKPEVIGAFANTGIAVTIDVGNEEFPSMVEPAEADKWVSTNVKPFIHKVNIKYIAVGYEVFQDMKDKDDRMKLVGAITNIHQALQRAGINKIKVTTPLQWKSVITTTQPPSNARLPPQLENMVLTPLFEFLRETKSPLMINMLYFLDPALRDQQKNLMLFKPGASLHDPATKITYTNTFDIMLDSVYTSLKTLGYQDLDIVVSAVGWPSKCEPGIADCSPDIARDHNINVLKRADAGTPLMPNRQIETYIYSLFNENLNPSLARQNFGLFSPDFNSVYDFFVGNKNT